MVSCVNVELTLTNCSFGVVFKIRKNFKSDIFVLDEGGKTCWGIKEPWWHETGAGPWEMAGLGETGNDLTKTFRSDRWRLHRDEGPGTVFSVHTGTMPTELYEVEVLSEGIGGVGMLVDLHKQDAAFHAPVLHREGLNGDVSCARSRLSVVDDGDRSRVVFIKASSAEWCVTDLK